MALKDRTTITGLCDVLVKLLQCKSTGFLMWLKACNNKNMKYNLILYFIILASVFLSLFFIRLFLTSQNKKLPFWLIDQENATMVSFTFCFFAQWKLTQPFNHCINQHGANGSNMELVNLKHPTITRRHGYFLPQICQKLSWNWPAEVTENRSRTLIIKYAAPILNSTLWWRDSDMTPVEMMSILIK